MTAILYGKTKAETNYCAEMSSVIICEIIGIDDSKLTENRCFFIPYTKMVPSHDDLIVSIENPNHLKSFSLQLLNLGKKFDGK